jgi:hypothetical protein
MAARETTMADNDAQELAGAWRLTSATMVIEAVDGQQEKRAMWSSGALLCDASGRMAVLLTAANREAVNTEAGGSEAGHAALYQSMLAYAGQRTVEDGQFITKVDVASNPAWVGTEQVRFYKLTGDRLSLWTATSQPPMLDGKAVTGYMEWTRESRGDN